MGPADPSVEAPVTGYEGAVKDLHGLLAATRNLEINLFWQRSNYFLILNSGLALGFFNLKDEVYRPIFAVMGLAASSLWFWVCLGGKYWQTRWEQRLMDFEAHHLPGLALFAADRDRIQSDVTRGLGFHPAGGLKGTIYRLALRYRPSVSYSMILLAGVFIIAWAAVAVVTARRMGAFLAVLLFASSVMPSSAVAQTFTELERSVLPFADTLGKDDPALKNDRNDVPRRKRYLKDFWDGLAELRMQEAAERALKGKLGFGFSGDSTERDAGALYKIDMSGELSRGTYPAELRFQSNVTSQIKDGKSTEDLSRFLVNYDYDVPGTPLEVYAFAERMSDSYLGIDSRTEVGVGMSVHHAFGAWDRPKQATIVAFAESLDQVAATIERAYPGRAPAMLVTGRPVLRRESDRLWRSIQERSARLDLGFAMSAFSEFERAHVSSDAETDGQLKEDETFPLPARQRFRLTLRPTVEWRLTRTAFISVAPYWKGPLFGDWKGERDGRRRLDYRWDVFTEVKDDLKVSDTGNETVSLVLRYEYHYDNLPPTLSDADLASQASQRVTAIASPAGPRTHHVVRMSLQVSWGG
jgi:hypothetical protein